MIKFNLTKKLFLLIFISINLACSKFEDGPAFSLLPVKTRIARDWKTEYVINLETGVTHSADYNGWLLSISKNGTFVNKVVYDLQTTQYSGKWELEGKNQLKFEYSAVNQEIEEFYTITRLTSSELWIKDQFQEFHYYSNN
ncbi:MAG: hypothetical protein U0W24_14885 [Bacteroidales bacterium]